MAVVVNVHVSSENEVVRARVQEVQKTKWLTLTTGRGDEVVYFVKSWQQLSDVYECIGRALQDSDTEYVAQQTGAEKDGE